MQKYRWIAAVALTAVMAAVYGLALGCAFTDSDAKTASAPGTAAAGGAPQAETAPVSSRAAAANRADRLFSDSLTRRLTVYISQEEWDGISQDMLDYQDIDVWMRTGNYRRADLVYEDDEGAITVSGVGIRTRGNTTRILPEDEAGYHRAHFALSFNETFDLSEYAAQYMPLKNRTFFGLTALNLKWNLWTDPSHIRELYGYALLNAAGVTAPRAALASLDFVIAGKLVHYGVYTIIEPIDKAFLTSHFGAQANDGNLYKSLWENTPATLEPISDPKEIGVKDWKTGYRPAYDLQTNEDAAATWDLEAFIDNINGLNDADFAAYIASRFEVDRFLRYLAVNLLLGNADDYRTMGNNYYLYFNNAGKIELLPYDYDACLGGGWNGGSASSYEALATEDIHAALNLNASFLGRDVAHPLVDRILVIPEYRERYEHYLKSFIESGLFSYDTFREKFEKLKTLYGDAACSDTLDSGESMTLTNEEWFFAVKTDSVLSQLATAVP